MWLRCGLEASGTIALRTAVFFSVMMMYGVYPAQWGVALVRALLKQGKPKHLASSFRGTRLLTSLASWFGRVFDERARKAWQPGPEQSGFRSEVGCSEAIALLMSGMLSRTLHNQRH